MSTQSPLRIHKAAQMPLPCETCITCACAVATARRPGRADYVSTWTFMHLAPVRCRVLLHSLLPTDDACSSSSLSTTVIKFPYFRTPLANFLLSRPNSVEYGNCKITTLLHRLNVRVHSSKVELAAAGVHPVGMISSHASVSFITSYCGFRFTSA